MTFKQLKQNQYFKFFTNRYVIILLVFIVWMLFFDQNSYLIHREFSKEIKELENTNEFYLKKTQENLKNIQLLKDSSQLERFAREHYLLKKKNEDVYIIEFDTLKKK